MLLIEYELKEESEQGYTKTIELSFNLRPDFTLDVELPADLTEVEAERFAQFFWMPGIQAGLMKKKIGLPVTKFHRAGQPLRPLAKVMTWHRQPCWQR